MKRNIILSVSIITAIAVCTFVLLLFNVFGRNEMVNFNAKLYDHLNEYVADSNENQNNTLTTIMEYNNNYYYGY